MSPNSRRQLAHEIADIVRRRIVEGDLPPGQWLRQDRIAQEHDVSQTPVREALKRLETEGLVEHLPYRGIRVIQVSLEDAEDLFSCRVDIEGRAARFAAINITWNELDTLLSTRERITQSIRSDQIAEYQELNRSFHDQIIKASRRPLLSRVLSGLWTTYPGMLWPSFRDTTKALLAQRFQADETEHDAIVDAMKNRDADRAERAMRLHIRTSADTLLATARSELRKEPRD